MGKPGPTTDRSCSGAMIRKIIRAVNMRGNVTDKTLPPLQKAYCRNNVGTQIMFKKWRVATQNSCNVNTVTNPRHTNCIEDGKNTGKCCS